MKTRQIKNIKVPIINKLDNTSKEYATIAKNTNDSFQEYASVYLANLKTKNMSNKLSIKHAKLFLKIFI